MSSRPYNQWPQSNGFDAPQADLNLYPSSDSQQSQQLHHLPSLHLQNSSTVPTLSNSFVDTHQTRQYATAVNPHNENHIQVYNFGAPQTSSNLPLNAGSSQVIGSMLDDPFEVVQPQLPSPSQPGGTFHQSKRLRPLGSQEDPDLTGEFSPEKESGKRQ